MNDKSFFLSVSVIILLCLIHQTASFRPKAFTRVNPRTKLEMTDEVDYVVIGSGIGGLSCAALLGYYGYSVTVLESHYLPGGCAHSFTLNGFKFGKQRYLF